MIFEYISKIILFSNGFSWIAFLCFSYSLYCRACIQRLTVFDDLCKTTCACKKYASLSQRYDTYIISGSQISNDVACLWYYVNKHILHLYSKYSVYYTNLHDESSIPLI